MVGLALTTSDEKCTDTESLVSQLLPLALLHLTASPSPPPRLAPEGLHDNADTAECRNWAKVSLHC